jgi:hypothetical protein
VIDEEFLVRLLWFEKFFLAACLLELFPVLLLPCCVCSWLLLVFWIRNLSLDDSKLIWLVVLLQKTLMLGSTPSSGRIHWRGSTSGAWRTAVVMAMAVDSVAPKRGCTGSLLEKRCRFRNHLVT